MVAIQVAASAIAALVTTITAAITIATWIYNRGRRAEQQASHHARITADIEELKRRPSGPYGKP